MMYLLQAPTQTKAVIKLPYSKSISNRALILNALSGGHCRLEQLADCDDSRFLMAALNSADTIKNIGAAGTAMRFLTAYYAMTEGEWVLTGSERMKHRPIALLADALNGIGAKITYLEQPGFPPLAISGRRLSGGKIALDGSVSSQYLSALMMIAPATEKGLDIHIENRINSRPYLEMTAAMMRDFGVNVRWQGNDIRIPLQAYRAPEGYVVEADWSAASYWFEIMSLMSGLQSDANQPVTDSISGNAVSEIVLQGLSPNSMQGDARVKEWFESLGVTAVFEQKGLVLKSIPVACRSFEADFSHQPDLAQTFAVTCVLKGIRFALSGLESLKIKETDRIQALINEMRKMGFVLTEQDNVLRWQGECCEPQADIRIDTYEDHRMAMAFAPAAIYIAGQSQINSFGINHPEVVAKSYTTYWQDLISCGFNIINENR